MKKAFVVLALLLSVFAFAGVRSDAVPYQTEWYRNFGVVGHKCSFGFDIHNAVSTGFPQAGAEIVSCPSGWHGGIEYIVVSTNSDGSSGWSRDFRPPVDGYTTVGTMVHATDTNPPHPTAAYGYYAVTAVNESNGCAYWGAVEGVVGDGHTTGQEVFGFYGDAVGSITACPS